MKWGKKTGGTDEADDGSETIVADETTSAVGKGRPTPKRRDVVGRRGPVTAPKNRKEAYARQKEQAKNTKVPTAGAGMTPAERREAMRRGDPAMLPRRDQGATKKLARDYVDSRRLASNYLLLLFLIILVATFVQVPILQFLVLILFLGLLVEWYIVGRRVVALAIERNGSAEGSAFSIGFYSGSRAYIPRRWRLPKPQYEIGDEI